MITVIAPHARPEFSNNLLVNFRRQRGVDARLVIVANGLAAESADPDASFEGRGLLKSDPPLGGSSVDRQRITVLTSGNHQSDAMNTGLEWLRANGAGAWARFDDDDYYGPDYLSTLTGLLGRDGVDVVGKRWGFVMFDDGLWRFDCQSEFTGGTLGARSAAVLPFFERDDDDLDWCRRMRASGASFAEGEPWGYCYNRCSRGSPRVISGCAVVTRWGFGDGHYYGSLPFESVDDRSLRALRFVQRPSDAEMMAALAAR